MVTAVIVCGYGKHPTDRMIDYIETLLREIAIDFALKGEYCKVIFSGGDTEDGRWKTEAQMMEAIANRVIAKGRLLKNRMSIETEDYAYNTFTNVLLSKRKLGNEFAKFDKIVIVCNEAHYVKSVFACIKIFSSRAILQEQKVIFFTFPLTKRFSENIKTYLKTPFEVFGYFFRLFGRYLEYRQWRIRVGRSSKMSFCKFCEKFTKSGELL